MVVPPKHLKMIIFSRKTHGFVGETHHFRVHPHITIAKKVITTSDISKLSRGLQSLHQLLPMNFLISILLLQMDHPILPTLVCFLLLYSPELLMFGF